MATQQTTIRAVPKVGDGSGDALPKDLQEHRTLDVFSILRGETVMTARTRDGAPAELRVPHSILAILVTISLAVVGGGFWLVSSITEMKTNLAAIQQNQRDDRQIYTSNLKLMTAYATNETNRVQFLTGLLTPTQQRQIFEYDKANPRPKLPNLERNDDARP